MQVKTRLALCAEVFAEAGLTVIYPTPCEETRETDVSRDSRQKPPHLEQKGGGGDRRERGIRVWEKAILMPPCEAFLFKGVRYIPVQLPLTCMLSQGVWGVRVFRAA